MIDFFGTSLPPGKAIPAGIEAQAIAAQGRDRLSTHLRKYSRPCFPWEVLPLLVASAILCECSASLREVHVAFAMLPICAAGAAELCLGIGGVSAQEDGAELVKSLKLPVLRLTDFVCGFALFAGKALFATANSLIAGASFNGANPKSAAEGTVGGAVGSGNLNGCGVVVCHPQALAHMAEQEIGLN